MTYIRFFFVLYWFTPILKFGLLPSENPRCAPETVLVMKMHTRVTVNLTGSLTSKNF